MQSSGYFDPAASRVGAVGLRLEAVTNVTAYISKLGPAFAKNAINMIKCAEEHRYIALGCDGMKHRGPTLFGMLLAFSGCNPNTANNTINAIWGLNGVDKDIRSAIIQKAFELGAANPKARHRLQSQLLPN